MSKESVLIIGAGPAGLTAGHLLSEKGFQVFIYESHPHLVGGLSKTVNFNGFSFDLGGHRFYTKAPEVAEYWHSILGDKFMKRSRLSRIYYNQTFFQYPLRLADVLKNLSWWRGFTFLTSYLKVKVFPIKEIVSFEDWVTANFGKGLYQAFFKSYTEKVWGRACHEISKDWAAQRINNLNISKIIIQFLKGIFGIKDKEVIKSLIDSFDYPEKGPGMLWETVKERIEDHGGQVFLGAEVTGIEQSDRKWTVTLANGTKGPKAEHIISTCPLKQLLENLTPSVSEKIKDELSLISYRDFLTVVLMFKKKESFPDNWIYIHDDRVKVARIQNYKNWSPHMVPSDDYTSYGLEFFCQKDDELWALSDEKLKELAIKEVKIIGLPFSDEELEAQVIRMPYAYPVYDHEHQKRSLLIREELKKYPNLHLIGRNGMHRYNNQDHSIKTAMLVVNNIIKGKEEYDPWKVNQDAIYLEEDKT
ncbi:MAG: NAD(P)/FAD-dependent oxidoreductase [Bacteriovoracaceae bacterium]|nr:NAD(P)/FAD-dependent oxidoreductase [Bacteriovoracaceae bacterium]